MARPGEYIEIAGGKIVEIYEGDYNIYAGRNIILNAGKSVILHGEKGIRFGEPQDPPKAKGREGATETTGKEEETDFDIKIELLEKDSVFLPLGVKEFKGETINDKIKFKITINGKGVNNWYLTIHELAPVVSLQPDKLIYRGISASDELDEVTITGKRDKVEPQKIAAVEANKEIKRFWPAGEYEIEWDGFNTQGVYDSASFQKKHEVKITGRAEGKEKSATMSFAGSDFKYDWLQSIEINRNLKQVNISIGVALYDGGETGLSSGEDVSAEALAYYKQEPLKARTKSFLELKDMALAGIHKFWSRNAGNIGKGVKIGEEIFEVFVHASWDNSKGLTGPKLRFVTNQSGGRSRNWELSRILYYNAGYLYDDNWRRSPPTEPIYKNKGWWIAAPRYLANDFEMTSSHEIAHELLLTLGGNLYSKQHKGTSTILQEVRKDNPLPEAGEIDLMKYYEDYYAFDRTVLSEVDLLGLIACHKVNVSKK